jgi:predicted nucleic acid-binding protein
MAVDVPRNLIVDTCVWYGLFDPRDPYSQQAQEKQHFIETLRVVLPWPILYETIRTKFVRNRGGMLRLEKLLERPNVERLDDARYREDALAATFREARMSKRTISLCDMLIRSIIEDPNVRIHALLTFNVKDFHDVCARMHVAIL